MREEVYEILKLIEDRNYQAYLVGGYPRDSYLGKKTNDFDICTNATPEELKQIFSHILEENYGSLKIKYKDILFEITTFRVEYDYTSVRSPKITYAKTLEEDLIRRDFTINTLCIDKNGTYIDKLGAKEDIKNRIIRCVGNPYQKMKEDPLRILRAIRFATTLDFEIEMELQKSILENRNLVANLSYYRKREELDKILESGNCNVGISLLQKFGLDNILECNFSSLIPVSNLETMWAQFTYSPNYPFTKKEKKNIEMTKKFLSKGVIEDIDLYYYGEIYFVFLAQVLGEDYESLKTRYQNLPIHSSKEIKVSNDTIQSITKEPISSVILRLEKEIVNGNLKNDTNTIILFLKEYFHE